MIFPDAFISLAEQTGLIEPLTDWMLKEGMQQCATWQKQGLNTQLSLNLSAKILNNLLLPDKIVSLAKENSINPETIILEVTETSIMNQPTVVMDILTRLRIKGFFLSIDDFGTGYSSLTQLHKMPFNELKIDKSFVTDMDEDVESKIITKALVELGHNLGLTMVAEGIQTKKTWDMLIDMGCDIAQGYFISPPLNVEDFEQWFKTRIDSDLRLLDVF